MSVEKLLSGEDNDEKGLFQRIEVIKVCWNNTISSMAEYWLEVKRMEN